MTAFDRDNPLLTHGVCKRCGLDMYYLRVEPVCCSTCLYELEDDQDDCGGVGMDRGYATRGAPEGF